MSYTTPSDQTTHITRAVPAAVTGRLTVLTGASRSNGFAQTCSPPGSRMTMRRKQVYSCVSIVTVIVSPSLTEKAYQSASRWHALRPA